MRLGAHPRAEGGVEYRVWAPRAQHVEVELVEEGQRQVLQATGSGYFAGVSSRAHVGSLYGYCLDGQPWVPDPASRSQPAGVFGPSRVAAVSPARGLRARRPWHEQVLYEVHVGAFSPQGTFAAVAQAVPRLASLGITAMELLPLAQCPGNRNWGYDGVFPFAVSHEYGGVEGLLQLVEACHDAGIAVLVDVVYNHLGPEGNCTALFGPYESRRCRTPWGQALNFDQPGSDEVRRFFIDNALFWLEEVGADGLRLDAIHEIHDSSAVPFLEQLSKEVRAAEARQRRPLWLIAEDDSNSGRCVAPGSAGGFAMDAVWLDDFHHSLHALLTRERSGYYRDFGSPELLAEAWRRGFAYRGQFSKYRGRQHGRDVFLKPSQAVTYLQNHDQVGNRPGGERLGSLLCADRQRLAVALLLLSPFVPMLFMGEERGLDGPFLYFADHQDEGLREAVRAGRRRDWDVVGQLGKGKDPYEESTFRESRLPPHDSFDHRSRESERFYQRLLSLRHACRLKESTEEADGVELLCEGEVLRVLRGARALMLFNLSARKQTISLPWAGREAVLALDTAQGESSSPGKGRALPEHLSLQPWAAVCYLSETDGHLAG